MGQEFLGEKSEKVKVRMHECWRLEEYLWEGYRQIHVEQRKKKSSLKVEMFHHSTTLLL